MTTPEDSGAHFIAKTRLAHATMLNHNTLINYRALRFAFLIALLLIGIISCTTGPMEVTIPVQVPEQFTTSGEDMLPEKWWISFNDPELNSLLEQALTNNLTLRSVWDRLAQAEAVARREGANIEPSLNILAGLSRSAVRQEIPKSSGGTTKDRSYFNDFSLGVLAEYELDLWGRISSVSDAALLDAEASVEDIHAVAITLSAQVARTWFQLVEQRRQLQVLADQLDSNLKIQELVTLRFRRGLVGAADVLRQRQLVESIRGDIERATSRAEVLKLQLAVLLGRSPAESIVKNVVNLVALPPLPESGLPIDLIKRRPDIRQAYLRILAADRRVASAVAERFPRLTLTARITTSADEVSNLFETWLASIGADLLAPVLDSGRRKAEVDRNRAILSERLHDYGQVILEAFVEVESALVQEQKQKDLIVSLEKQQALSDQVVERIRDNYINGALDYLRVLDALISNQSLQRSLLEARRQLIEYRIDLCRALAGGFEMRRPKLAVHDGEEDGESRISTSAESN